MNRLACTALTAALAWSMTGSAKAQDTIRLGGTGDAQVQDLLFDGQADIEQVYYRAGGYRGHVGGHVAYRSFAYRPYAYRPYAYRPYAYRPYVYRPYVYRPYAYRPYYASY